MHRTRTAMVFMTFILVLFVGLTLVHGQDDEPFRRWTNDKTMSCTTGGDSVYANLTNQTVEFNNLPSEAQFSLEQIKDGVLVRIDGPYGVEQFNETRVYGSFSTAFDSYPFTFVYRINTLIDGVIVYQSSITIHCSRNMAAVPARVINRVPSDAHTGTGDANVEGESAQGCVSTFPRHAPLVRLVDTPVPAYARADLAAITEVMLPGASSWRVISAEDNFTRLWIACNANPVWIANESITTDLMP